MSTLDTPMPNATGTETQPAPMVEVKALEWKPSAGGHFIRAKTIFGDYAVHIALDPIEWFYGRADSVEATSIDAAQAAAQADFERRVLACLHPAPATLADETLRAQNERLTAENARFKRAHERHLIMGAETLARAEAAEAKLAALSQPAPVVEDRTAREVEKLRELIDKIEDHLNEFGEAALPIVGETIGMWRHGQELAAAEKPEEPKPKTRKYVIIRKPARLAPAPQAVEEVRREAAEDERDRLYAYARRTNWGELRDWLYSAGAKLPADRQRARAGQDGGA